MAMPCATCGHPSRDRIDADMVSGRSIRSLVREWGISRGALSRHKAAHVSPALATVVQSRRGVSLLDRIDGLVTEAEQVLTVAKSEGKANLALSAIRELRESLKLLGTATGELKPERDHGAGAQRHAGRELGSAALRDPGRPGAVPRGTAGDR